MIVFALFTVTDEPEVENKKQVITRTGGEPRPGERDEKICAQYICDPSVQIAEDGRVIAWDLYAARSYAVTFLQIWRPIKNNRYELIGETRFEADAPRHFRRELAEDEQFHVKKGDTIGFYYPECSVIPYNTSQEAESKLLSCKERSVPERFYKVGDKRIPFYEKPEVGSEREFEAASSGEQYKIYSLRVEQCVKC